MEEEFDEIGDQNPVSFVYFRSGLMGEGSGFIQMPPRFTRSKKVVGFP